MVKHISNPVVSTVPTTGIPDAATRRALQTLAAGWSVRNGQTDEHFITQAEINGGLARLIVAKGFNQLFHGSEVPEFGDVGAVIDGIVASIMQSKSWQRLGERIAWITVENDRSIQRSLERIEALEVTEGDHWEEVQGIKIAVDNNWAAWLVDKELFVSANEAQATQINTLASKVGTNLSLIQNFKNTQTNWNAATAQQYSQLQTALGQNKQAIQQEALARQTANGKMEANYTVKIDQNGYITGYDLMSEADNGTPASSFIVRADRFAIGSPTGSGITPTVPFIVLTTTDSAGNKPGAYMNTAVIRNASIDFAKIKDASIDTAKIKDLSVDTIKIAGGAITVPLAVQVFPNESIPSGQEYKQFASLTANYKEPPAGVLLIANIHANNFGGGTGCAVKFTRNGNYVLEDDVTVPNGISSLPTFLAMDPYPPRGSVTYRVLVKNIHSSGQWTLVRLTFCAWGGLQMIYTVFDENGRITGAGSGPVLPPNAIEGSYSGFEYYIADGKPVAFPPCPAGPFYLWNYAERRWGADRKRAEAMARNERDQRLAACDWTQMPDVAPEIRAAWTPYRQALRDVPEQAGFPFGID